MIDQENQSPSAKAQGICHTEEECQQMYAELDPTSKAAAIKALADKLTPFAPAIQEEWNTDPLGFWPKHHFWWGMAVRNFLRDNGFGEKELGVHNLDDIYTFLVEEALELKVL